MNSTFMFGEDRFGPEQDYAATYQALGGRLPAERVQALIGACYEHLYAQYLSPAHHERFRTLREAWRALPSTHDLPNVELERLEQTFAAHELGHVPAVYAAALQRLAVTHRLGLVADIWAPKEPWLAELRRAGVLEVFETTVFSSDIGCVKPSPRGFLTAIQRMQATPDECVVIGDSARRDVAGARAAGLTAIWVGKGDPPPGAAHTVRDLLELIP
ncbi:MAG: HAD family hydrolase [Bacteroidota bacterium]